MGCNGRKTKRQTNKWYRVINDVTTTIVARRFKLFVIMVWIIIHFVGIQGLEALHLRTIAM
jgi:hypothetical protein